MADEKFKATQVIQIRQHELLHDALPTVADPPVHGPGPIDFWIYATVKEVMPDGLLRVVVDHPGNREHSLEKFVDPADVRTKADVAAIAARQLHTNPGWNARLQEHHRIQAERLT